MNIVLDQLQLSGEGRQALNPLLPEGLMPFHLSADKGIDGKLREDEGIVLITELPIDVLKYHGTFFEQYAQAPQWHFILTSENDHGLSILKDNCYKYNLQNCRFFHAPDSARFQAAIEEIASKVIKLSGKALLFSRHTLPETRELAEYLFGEDTKKYEIAYEEVGETDASFLLLCGKEVFDFHNVKLPEEMEPVFVIMEPEEHLQYYLKPEELQYRLAAEFEMTEERVADRLFFVSTAAQRCREKKKTGRDMLAEGFLMWDRFGLPVSAEAYTEENIAAFLKNGYFDGEKLKKLLRVS